MGCVRPSRSGGMCDMHYSWWVTNGGGRSKKAAATSRRRALIAGLGEVDSTLSWASFWSDGLRHCAICSGECDPSDYRFVTNRVGRRQKICGPTYPSLDHIVPLSKGGTHAADNVQLACMQCNRKKWTRLGHEAQHGESRSDQAVPRQG